MSDTIHTVPTIREYQRDRLAKWQRDEEAALIARFGPEKAQYMIELDRAHGIMSRSTPRVGGYWDEGDTVYSIEATDEWLRFRVSDPDHLDRGRQHEITIGHELIWQAFWARHGDGIVRLNAKIAELEEQLRGRDALLTDLETMLARRTQP
jgi:hypothetical protein